MNDSTIITTPVNTLINRPMSRPSLLKRCLSVFAAGPVKPGESYGAPGQGKSLAIS